MKLKSPFCSTYINNKGPDSIEINYCYFNFNEKKDLSNIFPLYGGFTAFLLIFCIQKKQAYDFSSILGNSSNELAD